MAKREEIAKKFEELFKYMIDTFVDKSGFFGIFVTFITTYAKTDKYWLVEQGGPFFIKNRERILGDDIDYFINKDWSHQSKDWGAISTGYGASFVKSLEDAVKAALIRVKNNPDLHEMCKQITRSLLGLYCEYIQASRAEL